MYCWFENHLGLLTILLSIQWCIFSHVFPSKPSTITGFQGAHWPNSSCDRTSHEPSLNYCSCHILATNRDILLAFVQNSGQGITVQPTAGTPTPNCFRSNWDFLLGRSSDMLAGPTLCWDPKNQVHNKGDTHQVWTLKAAPFRFRMVVSTRDNGTSFPTCICVMRIDISFLMISK